jgi:nucleoid-associated protein YgaU
VTTAATGVGIGVGAALSKIATAVKDKANEKSEPGHDQPSPSSARAEKTKPSQERATASLPPNQVSAAKPPNHSGAGPLTQPGSTVSQTPERTLPPPEMPADLAGLHSSGPGSAVSPTETESSSKAGAAVGTNPAPERDRSGQHTVRDQADSEDHSRTQISSLPNGNNQSGQSNLPLASSDEAAIKPERQELLRQGWVPVKHAGAGAVRDLQRADPKQGDESSAAADGEGSVDASAHNDREQSFDVVSPTHADRGATHKTGTATNSPNASKPTPVREEGTMDTVLHKVERGENFWTIARLYYPSGRYYRALWKYNSDQVKAVDMLYVGTTIQIPPPEELDPAFIDPPGAPAPRSRREKMVKRDDGAIDSARTEDTAAAERREGRYTGVPVRRSSRSESELNLPISDPQTEQASGRALRTRNRPVSGGNIDGADDQNSDPEFRSRDSVTRPIYKVRPYDTLRTIARDTLGDSRRSSEILDLNRDIIDDPGHLIVGQILELPEDARTMRARSRR